MESAVESALVQLRMARREIVASREWEELLKEAMLMVSDNAQILVQGSKRCVGNEPLSKEVSKRLQRTQTYRELQARITSFLVRHFKARSHSLEQTAIHCFVEDDSSSLNMLYACIHLLQANTGLKQQLKKALNHPIPYKLRRAAWRALLIKHPLTPEAEQEIQQKLQKLGVMKLEREAVNKKVSNLLEATPTLTFLSKSFCAMGILKTVGFFWKQENNGLLTNSDLFLLAPFAREWSEIVNPQKTNCEYVLFDVLEAFISFMKDLPPTMVVDVMNSKAQETAIEYFCKKIVKLLRINDLQLHNHLDGVFAASDATAPFNKHLATLLKLPIQHMLVGDLPLDVVLYIWDQCFIGRAVPHYQCLHYFITVWLTILREELMACADSKGFGEVLTRNSTKLTIDQFQKKVEKDYLNTLSAELQVTPFKLPSATVSEEVLRTEHKPSPGVLAAKDSLVSTKEQELDTEKEELRQEIRSLEKEIAKQHKALMLKVEKEKRRHKQEVQILHQEIAMLRKKADRRPPTPFVNQRSNRFTRSTSSLTNSTLTNAQSVSGASSSLSGSSSSHRGSSAFTSTNVPSSQLSPRFEGKAQITLEEAQQVWLRIFKGFSNGLSLLCHGLQGDASSQTGRSLSRIQENESSSSTLDYQHSRHRAS